MDDARRVHTDTSRYYVSTGHLPTPDIIAALVSEAHQRFKSNTEGKKSDVYPASERTGARTQWRYRL